MAYLAVIIAAIAAHVLGFLWYGPLFGKKWMALMKLGPKDMDKAKQKGMAKTYLMSFVASLVTAGILYFFVNLLMTSLIQRELLLAPGIPGELKLALGLSIVVGAFVGLLAWLGFVATKSLGSVFWEGKSWSLYLLNTAYDFVNLLLMGAIIGGLSGFSWA